MQKTKPRVGSHPPERPPLDWDDTIEPQSGKSFLLKADCSMTAEVGNLDTDPARDMSLAVSDSAAHDRISGIAAPVSYVQALRSAAMAYLCRVAFH